MAPAAKTRPHRLQAFKKVNNGQAFPQEETMFSFLVTMYSQFQLPQKHAYKKFRANIRKIRLPRVNIKSFLLPKVDPILKLSSN